MKLPHWMRCRWGRWKDIERITKVRKRDQAVVREGIVQHRYCEHCNKLQGRIAWDGEQL